MDPTLTIVTPVLKALTVNSNSNKPMTACQGTTLLKENLQITTHLLEKRPLTQQLLLLVLLPTSLSCITMIIPTITLLTSMTPGMQAAMTAKTTTNAPLQDTGLLVKLDST